MDGLSAGAVLGEAFSQTANPDGIGAQPERAMRRIPATMRMSPAMRGDGATSPRPPGFGGAGVFIFTLKVPPFGGREFGSPYRLGFYGHFGGPWLKEGNIELKSSLKACGLDSPERLDSNELMN